MSPTKEQLKKDLLGIIQKTGNRKDKFLVFNLDKFLQHWEKLKYRKFQDLGYGKLTTFLCKECSVENVEGQEYRLPIDLHTDGNKRQPDVHPAENVLSKLFGDDVSAEDESQGEQMSKQEDGPTTTGAGFKQETCAVRLVNLKREVLSVLHEFILNKKKKRKRKSIALSLNELNLEWQSINPGQFRRYGFGNFRSFLLNHCNLRRPSDWNDEFVISLQDIETELKNVERAYSRKDVNAKEERSEPEKLACNDVPTDKIDEESPLVGCADDASSGGHATPLSQENLMSRSISIPQEVTDSDDLPLMQSADKQLSENERYFLQFVTVLYKCGLEGLRKLFMHIHPGWSNTKRCLKDFKKGKLKLDDSENRKFESGDIHQWDITLIAKVLLYTEVSHRKLKTDLSFSNMEEAVKKIRDIKNELLSHNKSNELTKSAFKKASQELKNAVLIIGITEEDFEGEIERADLTKQNLYFKMFLEEQARCRKSYEQVMINQQIMKEGISEIKDDVRKILAKACEGEIKQSEIPQQIKKENPQGWNQWLTVKKQLRNLDVDNNQYLLVVDRMQPSDADDAKILANVPWKLVLDLDPDSDYDGFLSQFTPGETKGGVVVTHTPSQLKDITTDSLVDDKRMQWLFVNGRNLESPITDQEKVQLDNEDKPKDSFCDWEISFKTRIKNFIEMCCNRLDKMKPTIFVVLNIRTGLSIRIVQNIIWDLYCKFFSEKIPASYISFAPELDIDKLSNATFYPLPQKLFLAGLSSLIGAADTKYQLPTSQTGLPTHLSPRQYNFLTEYLEILYKGCEEIPDELSEEEKENFKNEHLKKFLSGNAITFPSLHYRHDATRHITSDICHHIIKIPTMFSKSQIVQITHAPGSGGTTVSRRVLWDLHLKIPCAIVKTEFAPEGFGPDSEGERYLKSLCERITLLEDICKMSPVILVDGSSRLARFLSDCIVRKLEGKAVILRCVNYREMKEPEDSFFHTASRFEIDPELKKDEADHNEFRIRYDDYCKKFHHETIETKKPRDRVFHFPMMAMLGEFTKLKEIVRDTLDILMNEIPVEYEIAILVAFIQRYATFPTPASFIGKYFIKHSQTYEEVADNFSETLINLMVPEKAPTKEKFIGSVCSKWNMQDDDDDEFLTGEGGLGRAPSPVAKRAIQSYTFQHPQVAKLVLEHSGRDLDQITQDFVKTKILESYRANNENKPLIDNLFLYNKENSEEHFSLLVQELSKVANGGRILEEAAKQTKDVTFHSHVARFFADKKNFQKARSLIKEGFDAEKNASIEKKRGVLSTEGYIVLKEMKLKKKTMIKDIDDLKRHSEEALRLFRNARDNPPRIFPNPLIGEVTVWLFCFEWIIQDNALDVEEAIKFILDDEFFSGSISDCITLLDEVDQIVQTVTTLNDPAHTRKIANEKRLELTHLLGRSLSKRKRRTYQAVNIQRICEEIVSKYVNTASEKEIIRLRVLWLMSQAEKKLHRLEDRERKNLFDWLRKLVKDYNMWVHTRDLMDVAAVQKKPPFSIDQALSIVNKWQKNLPNDPFSYFYQYIICFVSVCHGEVFDYRPSYEAAIEACTKKTQGNPRKHLQQYYIGKEGEEGSICTVLSRSVLEAKYLEGSKSKKSPKEADNDMRRSDDILDAEFWEKHSRKYLLECRGRILLPPTAPIRCNKHPYIQMELGSLKVAVPRHAVGTAYVDYRPDSRVTFVVCFTFVGPKAMGIRFVDDIEKKGTAVRYRRQASSNGKSKK